MAKKHGLGIPRALEVSSTGPVTMRIVEAPGEGENRLHMELGIDYSKADVPERFYYADYCDVQGARSGYSLIFGKLNPGTSRLRTKVDVTFPEEMFRLQLWGNSRDFHQGIRRIAEKVDFPPVERVEDTDKVQSFRSNNVFMGMWGEESVMDFYYLSPRDIHFVRKRQKHEVALEPVIRVVLPTALLFEFLEKCRPYAERQPKSEASQIEVN